MKTNKPSAKTNKSRSKKRYLLLLLLLLLSVLVLLGLGAISALFLRSHQPTEQHDSPVTIASTTASDQSASSQKSTSAQDSDSSKSAKPDAKPTDPTKSDIKTVADLPKPINDGNYQPSDVAVEKTITIDEPIYFSKTTVNEVNQARGTTRIAQTGVNGNRKITYNVKYNSNGQSLAVEKIKEEVDRQPVAEIIKVGISDYNLNSAPTITYYHSGICLATDVDNTGCNKSGRSYRAASAFELGGQYYVYFIYELTGQNRTFSPALLATNGYTYAGEQYHYERYYSNGAAPLTAELCASYGLACGKW